MTTKLYPKLVLDALSNVRYPATGKDIVSSEMVADNIRIDGNKLSFSLVLKKNDPLGQSLVKAAEQAILTYIGDFVNIKGNISIQHTEPQNMPQKESLSGVKCKIAIASGKGGVGKSTVSANLAVSLAKQGYKVGLLDADLFGPSIPKMFGVEDAKPVADDDKKILPIEKYGVKVLSIGFFVDRNNAIVWRGAMASNAIKQLVTDANWGELDFFLIDLPPGTSDIHLSIIQALKLDGVIAVSTPQDVAILDARKAIDMFQNKKINIPVIGIIENMAWFTPAELPNNKYYIFGKGGVENLAQELQVPFMGQIPLVQSICESGDKGKPASLDTNELISSAFDSLTKSTIFEQLISGK